MLSEKQSAALDVQSSAKRISFWISFFGWLYVIYWINDTVVVLSGETTLINYLWFCQRGIIGISFIYLAKRIKRLPTNTVSLMTVVLGILVVRAVLMAFDKEFGHWHLINSFDENYSPNGGVVCGWGVVFVLISSVWKRRKKYKEAQLQFPQIFNGTANLEKNKRKLLSWKYILAGTILALLLMFGYAVVQRLIEMPPFINVTENYAVTQVQNPQDSRRPMSEDLLFPSYEESIADIEDRKRALSSKAESELIFPSYEESFGLPPASSSPAGNADPATQKYFETLNDPAKAGMIHQTAEMNGTTVDVPAGWTRYAIGDLATIDIPPSMELRTDEQLLKKMKQSRAQMGVTATSIVFQQLGFISQSGYSKYARVMISLQEDTFNFGRDLRTLSSEEKSQLDNQERERFRSAYEAFSKIKLLSFSKTVFGKSYTQNSYTTQVGNNPIVCVNLFSFYGQGKKVEIKLLHRVIESEYFKEDFALIPNTFHFR